MSKIDEFKAFAKNHRELKQAVSSGKATWQSLYELYDIYGSDDPVWKEYALKDELHSLKEWVSKIDTEAIRGHINTAQKALSLVEELTHLKSDIPEASVATPQEITHFFGD